jgi:hypothetical protein
MDHSIETERSKGWGATIRLLIIIGSAFLAVILICSGLIGWGYCRTFMIPADFAISLTFPDDLALGDECVLAVEVQNPRASRALALTDIDLAAATLLKSRT